MDGPGLSLFQDALVELYGANVFVNYANGSKIALPANVANAHFLHGLLGSRAISKPLVNQRVAELFGERGIAVPAEVQEVISYVAGLAAAEVAASVTPEETTPDQAGGGEGDDRV